MCKHVQQGANLGEVLRELQQPADPFPLLDQRRPDPQPARTQLTDATLGWSSAPARTPTARPPILLGGAIRRSVRRTFVASIGRVCRIYVQVVGRFVAIPVHVGRE